MPTIERKMPPIAFKEIVKKSVGDFENAASPTATDKDISVLLLNEKDEIMGRILGEESDCSYCPIQGHGCYISTLEYAENIPLFVLCELLDKFIGNCTYAITLLTKDTYTYRYDYIWFTVEDNNIATSALLKYYSKQAQEVYIDNKIRVYAVPVRNEVIKIAK